jgi:hypothetical protein
MTANTNPDRWQGPTLAAGATYLAAQGLASDGHPTGLPLSARPCHWTSEEAPGCGAEARYLLAEAATLTGERVEEWPVCATHLEPMLEHLLGTHPRAIPVPVTVELVTR